MSEKHVPTLAGEEVARLEVVADLACLPAVSLFTRNLGRYLGLGDKAAQELEHAVDECVTNILQHAFEPGERGEYTLRFLHRPGQVVVVVEDQGLPFDLEKFQRGEEAGLGRLLLDAYADQWNVSYLGARGKRLEIVKNLPRTDATAHYRPEELDDLRQAALAPADEKLEIRLMRPEDAVALARCVYRTYGYSYTSEYIYYPERTREMLTSGRMVSCVVVNPAGEIVGHIALLREDPRSRVGETGQALVDPRYRGRNLFKKSKRFLLDYARSQGLFGVYSESVTLHPYTQKGNLSLGATETGLLLGYVPQQMVFRRMEQGRQSQPQTVVLYYLRIAPNPRRSLFVPPRHQGMIQRIVDACGLKRDLQPVPDQYPDPPADSRLDIQVRSEWGQAFIKVAQAGRDLVPRVRAYLGELVSQGLRCIYLDISLADPFAVTLCPEMEEMGFFFAGLMPEMTPRGDLLRFQFLNQVELDLDQVVLVSDLGRELMRYIRDCR